MTLAVINITVVISRDLAISNIKGRDIVDELIFSNCHSIMIDGEYNIDESDIITSKEEIKIMNKYHLCGVKK